MKFIDEVVIDVQAGKGGAGCKHFRREKFVPRGGPDGGNGGRGGSVILRSDPNKHTLLDLRFKPHWKAKNGKGGDKSLKDGAAGADLVIDVPPGTQVYRGDTPDELLADLENGETEWVIARGGRGGKGNTFFKSATNQAPQQVQPGEEGEFGVFLLSLKLLADVGLIGYPNAGKSTLVSRISAARPKIADYPFTTLEPNLGVVKSPFGEPFVVADVPGLIPGAHQGKGLGVTFLKHIERTRLLVHLIDMTDYDEECVPSGPQAACSEIEHELRSFSSDVAAKEQVIALTKIDACPDRSLVEKTKKFFESQGRTCFCVSSASGEGIDELLAYLSERLAGEGYAQVENA